DRGEERATGLRPLVTMVVMAGHKGRWAHARRMEGDSNSLLIRAPIRTPSKPFCVGRTNRVFECSSHSRGYRGIWGVRICFGAVERGRRSGMILRQCWHHDASLTHEPGVIFVHQRALPK